MPSPELESSAFAHALALLEQRGARAFDADGCDCVRSLLTRADRLEPAARALLLRRAHEHLEQLARRFEHARERVEQQLTAAERQSGPLPLEREAFESGELAVVQRRLQRRACRPLFVQGTPTDRERCATEYETRRSEFVAAISVARAVDLVPEQAGPYNPLRIASQLLEGIRRVSPLYLTSQLQRLHELASLVALPEQPTRASRSNANKSAPPKRRGQGRSRA